MSKAGKKRSKKGHSQQYNVDSMAVKLWFALQRDFAGTEKFKIAERAKDALLEGIQAYRAYNFPERGDMSPDRFKKWYQLEHLFKKYRFGKDCYSDKDLKMMTLAKYCENQIRLSSHTDPGTVAKIVTQEARKIARRILGKFDPVEAINLAKFGKKSSIGCPLDDAYIDHKLTDPAAFTSNSECWKWFREGLLSGDPYLAKVAANYLKACGKDYSQHESLKLVTAEKTWKTHRIVMPLTLITLFYSYGVGLQVENSLRNEGLDLSVLQGRHRRFIRDSSVPGKGWRATADLSAASDSLTSPLLNRILPRDWYCAIKKTFTHQITYDECGHLELYTESVLPMGNGLTFPVETLVFYCLLKAMAQLLNVKGVISVYGDDLIYPSKLHPYVAYIFPRLGLKLNLDKTFVNFPFRESCGSDYYKGVDVRPFLLPAENQHVTKTRYLAWLYKVYNGLTRRWEEVEIRETLTLILAEIGFITKSIYRVPPSFPDDSGIKVKSPEVIPLGATWLTFAPVVVCFYSGSRWYHFHYLLRTFADRVAEAVWPYYWLSLQGKTDIPSPNFWETDFSAFSATLPGSAKLLGNEPPKQAISWKRLKRVRNYKSKDGKKHRKVRYIHKAFTPSRTQVRWHTGSNDVETVSDWL